MPKLFVLCSAWGFVLLPFLETAVAQKVDGEPNRASVEQAVQRAIEIAEPAVVAISVHVTPPVSPWPGVEALSEASDSAQLHDYGMGVVISRDGLVLTTAGVTRNYRHCQFKVKTPRSKECSASLVARDPWLDLAVLKLERPAEQGVKMGRSESLKKGASLLCFGEPALFVTWGEPGVQVAHLLLSTRWGVGNGSTSIGDSLQKKDDGVGSLMIQLGECLLLDDLSLNGCNGGPLINMEGELVGLVSGRSSSVQRLGIPMNDFNRAAVEKLARGEEIEYGLLGVHAISAGNTPEQNGVEVDRVDRGSPAELAGIQNGDLITHLNGAPVESADHLIHLVALALAGREVQLTVHQPRTGHTRVAKAQLAKLGLPEPVFAPGARPRWRNLVLEEASALIQNRESSVLYRGVGIIDVLKDTESSGKGVVDEGNVVQQKSLPAAGTVISRANGVVVDSVDHFLEVVRSLDGEVVLTDTAGRNYAIPPASSPPGSDRD